MCPAAAGRVRRCRNPHFKSSRILEGSREKDHWRRGIWSLEWKGGSLSFSFAEDVILLHIAKCVCMQRAISVKLSLTAWNAADVCNIVRSHCLLQNFKNILDPTGLASRVLIPMQCWQLLFPACPKHPSVRISLNMPRSCG